MVDSRKRIALAFLFGGTLVAAAFLMGGKQNTYAQEGAAAATVVERSHIDVEDTNGDGIPDWKEALQKTEPIVLPQTATTTYTKPTTFTGKFALAFFEKILRSKMYGSFGKSSEEVIQETTEALARETQDVLFTEEDIEIIETQSDEVIRAYGNHIATIALSQKATGDNEALILQDALRYDDPKRLTELEPIAQSYVTMVTQMLQTPVPSSYVKEHLDLLNAYNAVREDVSAMQKIYEDPMYTFIRTKRYQDDVLGMGNALMQLFDAITAKDKIEWTQTDSASRVQEILKTI